MISQILIKTAFYIKKQQVGVKKHELPIKQPAISKNICVTTPGNVQTKILVNNCF